MKSKTTFIIFLLLIVSPCFGLTGKDFLANIRSNYEDLESLELNMEYKLYKGFSGFDLKEQYSSVFRKDEKSSYRKIDQIEFITDESCSVTINHEQKTITISNPQMIGALEFDSKTSLNMCQDVKVHRSSDGLWTMKMMIKEMSDLPYAMVELKVDKNFWIEQIGFFYSAKMNFSDSYFSSEMDYARMVITYSNLKKKWQDKDGIMKIDKYLSIGPDEVIPAESFRDYEVYDFRTNIKKNKK